MISPQLSRHDHTPVAEMAQWFRNALSESDTQPSREQVIALAREFQVLLNRSDNDQKIRAAGANPPPLLELKDVDPKRVLSDKLLDVARAGKALLLQLERLEKYAGNYEWAGLTRSVTIEDVRDILFQTGSLAVDDVGPTSPARGQPPKAWHAVAHQLAVRVVLLLRALGYEHKATNPNEASSATAFICAEALAWAYQEKITEEGVASALRDRDRRKNKPQSGFEFDAIFSPSK
jgi:hypothetical protein